MREKAGAGQLWICLLTRPEIRQLPPVMAETSSLSLERICCSNNPYEFIHRPRNYQNLAALSKVKDCCSCFETLPVLLTEIVNRSLATGSIPQGLKTALQIRPLLTTGNLDSWEDHCPIFFISIWWLREQSVYNSLNVLKLMTLVKSFNRFTTVFTAHNDIWERLITTNPFHYYSSIVLMSLTKSTLKFCYIVLRFALVLKAVLYLGFNLTSDRRQ